MVSFVLKYVNEGVKALFRDRIIDLGPLTDVHDSSRLHNAFIIAGIYPIIYRREM